MWRFAPAPKIPGTHRVLPVEVTMHRASDILPLVPVTRISDLTPLDRLGLPTFSAVTPLASDLTNHLGKGRDPISAKVSAVMEAIERVSAEPAVPGLTTRASFDDLDRNTDRLVIDPRTLTLPSDSTYLPDVEYTWADSHDLVADRPVWMAADLVTSPPSEGLLHDVDTNGLASGNTRLEAVVHAICELIERDAWSQHEFTTEFADERTLLPPRRSIDLETLPDEAGVWADRIRSRGLRLVLHDITSDVGVATFQAMLTDPHYLTTSGQAMQFQGLGTHPTASTAALRAITEAVQARLGLIQGARDDYNTTPSSARSFTQDQRAAQMTASDATAFEQVPSVTHQDLLDDLSFLLARLLRVGIERVIVTDLTRPTLRIPVVRVRIPRLSGFVVNRRRVDWRCLRHLL